VPSADSGTCDGYRIATAMLVLALAVSVPLHERAQASTSTTGDLFEPVLAGGQGSGVL
jgi:hypothetical protein